MEMHDRADVPKEAGNVKTGLAVSYISFVSGFLSGSAFFIDKVFAQTPTTTKSIPGLQLQDRLYLFSFPEGGSFCPVQFLFLNCILQDR